jgi:hypothetical protein
LRILTALPTLSEPRGESKGCNPGAPGVERGTVKKSLLTSLITLAAMIAAMLLILRKGFWGPLILLILAALYFVLTVISEGIKIYGQKVQGRNRHP